ncbi:MAG: GntR family transcriptional regulator [Chloroflexota bacterium]
MAREAVDPASPSPLYQQLRSLLRDRIESGEYRSGDVFPSESELISQHSLSRITVRRAISELEREGLVVTRQGTGTFVADPTRAGAQCLLSFTSDMLRRGHRPGAQLLALRINSGPQHAARRLELADDADLLHIKRLRTVDGEPAFVSEAFVSADLFPHIAPDDLARSGPDQSLYRLIERHHPVPLVDGEEVATAVLADGEVQEIFALPHNSPVIRKTCLLRDRNGSPVIYEEATWGVPQHSAVIWRRSAVLATAGGERA